MDIVTMRYNTLGDHEDVFEIPFMMTDDKPLFVGITEIQSDQSGRDRWAYTIASGPYDADVQYQGDDLYSGTPQEPWEMTATLLSFLSAYAEGTIGDEDEPTLYFDGDVIATGETALWIVDNGERFGIVSSDLEEGYLAYSDETVFFNGVPYHPSYSTGKESE